MCIVAFVVLSSMAWGSQRQKYTSTGGQIGVVSIILDLAVLLKSTNQKGLLKIGGKQWGMCVNVCVCAIDNRWKRNVSVHSYQRTDRNVCMSRALEPCHINGPTREHRGGSRRIEEEEKIETKKKI